MTKMLMGRIPGGGRLAADGLQSRLQSLGCKHGQEDGLRPLRRRYVLLYLLIGKLPWQGLAHKRQGWAEQLATISNAKATANLDELAPDADVFPRFIKSAYLAVLPPRSWSIPRQGDSRSGRFAVTARRRITQRNT